MVMGTITVVVTDMGTHTPTMVDGVDMAAMVVAGEDLTSRMELKWVQGEHQEVLQLDKGEQGGVEEGVVQGMSPTKCFVGYLDAWEQVRK